MLQLKSRDYELKSIIRYKQNPVCKPMFYTPNLWIHVERVTWLTQELCQQLGLSLELSEKIIRRAMFHDDSEMIAGDVATPVKKNWSQKEKSAYELQCRNAIPLLVSFYGKEIGADYEEILYEEENKKNIPHNKEHVLVHAIIEYVDKLDALMETLHELSGGNKSFLSNMKEVFHKDMTCWEYIVGRVQSRYKNLRSIINTNSESDLLCFNQIVELDILNIVANGVIHSKESVQLNAGIEIYDIWKKLHFSNGNITHQEHLYTQNITR